MHGESPCLLSSHLGEPEWALTEEKLKRYPHFDAVISATEATRYATTPALVERHAFMPFLDFNVSWTAFPRNGQQGKKKSRKIRCAARRDSYIYSYYRHLLSERYEVELGRRGLGKCVLAYRKIKAADGGGKSNAHFATEAFDAMRAMGNCTVTTLDITQFFESIDHARLKDAWRRILGVERLPKDHFQVFKNITRYSSVPRIEALRRLGHFGTKRILPSGEAIEGYLTHHSKMPRQLCTAKEFRELIAGGSQPSIIQQHDGTCGIPQGSPISDVLANLYMLDFDTWMNEAITEVGGRYFRYSDDIMIIVPGAKKRSARHWIKIAERYTARYSSNLSIAPHKSTVHTLKKRKHGQLCTHVEGSHGRNGVEYLGFRYDGKRIFIRDSTLANLQRKITRTSRALARRHARRYADKSADHLVASFPYHDLISRFGPVERFKEVRGDKTKWSFWTYVDRALKLTGPKSRHIRGQLRRLKPQIRRRMSREIIRAKNVVSGT